MSRFTSREVYLTILKSITTVADLRIEREGMGLSLAIVIRSLLDEMARNSSAVVMELISDGDDS